MDSYWIKYVVGWCMLCLAFVATVQGQAVVEVRFKALTTEEKDGGLATNVLVVRNHTRQAKEVRVSLVAPSGWRVLGETERRVSVMPLDSLMVPVRVCPVERISARQQHVVVAKVEARGVGASTAIWNIGFRYVSVWQAQLLGHRVYFRQGLDTASFVVKVANKGNGDERLQLGLHCGDGVVLVRGSDEAGQLTLPLTVRAGCDTLVVVPIRHQTREMRGDQEGLLSGGEVSRIRVIVSPDPQTSLHTRYWQGAVECYQLNEEMQVMPSMFQAIPLVAELNTYNILSEYSYATLNLYGHKKLERHGGLFNYYYQTDFTSHQIDLSAFKGDYHYLSYSDVRMSVEGGDISAGRFGAMMSGRGVKGGYRMGSHSVGMAVVSQPDYLDASSMQGISGDYGYRKGNLSVDVFGRQVVNEKLKTDGVLGMMDASWRYGIHYIRGGSAWSRETHRWKPDSVFSVNGMAFHLGYNLCIGAWNYSLTGNYGSRGYVAQNGVLSMSTQLGYALNHSNRVQLYGAMYRYDPLFYRRGELFADTLFNHRNRISVKWLRQVTAGSIAVAPGYYMVRSSYLESNSGGVDFDYRTRSTSKQGAFVSVFAGYLAFPALSALDPIFVSNIRTTCRMGNLSLNMRYYYGPYNTIDQMQYVQYQENMQKVYLTGYHDWWMMRGRVNVSTGFNYYYNTWQKRHQWMLRPEMFYYSGKGVVLSVYGRYLLYGNGEYLRQGGDDGLLQASLLQPASTTGYVECGFGVKVNMNLPASAPRHFDAMFVVFRDINGNEVLDGSERVLENVLVKLIKDEGGADLLDPDYGVNANELQLLTDEKGRVVFHNLPKGNYLIETFPLSDQGAGESKKFYKEVAGKRTIYLPFNSGVRVSGALLVQKDRFGDSRELVLQGIRVMATNVQSQAKYVALTLNDGTFSMFLPGGQYVISVNEQALGDRYVLLENDVSLDVGRASENLIVNFQVAEKQRAIRMMDAGNE